MLIRTTAVALSVVLAAFAGSEPARAFHELECPAFRGTVTDPETGAESCGVLSDEARDQVVRTRQLLKQQQRRTQTSVEQRRQRQRPRLLRQEQEQRLRNLQVEQEIRAEAQGRITDLESGRQEQTVLRTAVGQRQPALDLRQAAVEQEIQNRQAARAKRRIDRARLSTLERERILLQQEIRRLKTDLLEEQKRQARILEKEQEDR